MARLGRLILLTWMVAEGDIVLVVVDEGAGDQLLIPLGPGAAWGRISVEDADLLAPAEPTCPAAELNVPLLARLGAAGIACMGTDPFNVVGYLPGFCGIPTGFFPEGIPEWLNVPFSSFWVYGEDPPGLDEANPPRSGVVSLTAAQGLEVSNCAPDLAQRWHRFTIHFDDPAARECRTRWPDDAGNLVEEEPAVSIARCRLTLVVSALEEVPAP